MLKDIGKEYPEQELQNMGYIDINTEGTGTPLVVKEDDTLRANGVKIGRVERSSNLIIED